MDYRLMAKRYDADTSRILGCLSIIDIEGNEVAKVQTVENTTYKIPKGNYSCRYTYSKKFKCRLLEIKGIEGRTGIRVHVGNSADDVRGCIAVGLYRKGNRVLKSKWAIQVLREILSDKLTYKIDIK